MDFYWTIAGGADPIANLTNYIHRYRNMYVKDMAKKLRFSGDGGDPKQWIELFHYMTTADNGVLDMVAGPGIALKKSFDYLFNLNIISYSVS